MRVRLMQIVDFWIGVPLCAVLSVWKFLIGTIIPRSPCAPKKILFIELSEMGSAILAHSALVQARELAGGEPPWFLIFKRNRESCEVLGILPRDHVLVIDDRSFPAFVRSAASTLWTLRTLGFDTVIDLELFSRFTALLTYLSGARNRVGFHRHTGEGLFRGNFLTHRVNYNPHQHMALNFLALVGALEAPAGEIPLLKRDMRPLLLDLPRHRSDESERRRVLELVQGRNPGVGRDSTLLIVNPDPGEAIPIRGWSEQSFAEVARALLDEYPGSFALVIGTDRSKPFAERFVERVGAQRCGDLTGATKTLADLLTLFELAALLVTNDSGPAHLAALTGLQSVVLFGPETPALYGPLGDRCTTLFAGYSCSPCLSAANHRHTWCSNNRCLQAITVAQVIGAARGALARAGVEGRPQGLQPLAGAARDDA